MTAQNNKALKPSADYFENGATWEHGVYANLENSRKRAWVVAFLSLGLAAASILCLILLLPLKTFEPYVVTVDQSSGYTEITRPLKQGALSEQEAITDSNLVRYVTLRESYNPHITHENYNLVALLSDQKALQEYEELWNENNPENPSRIAGGKGTTDVKIKSVSPLNNETSQVRFLTRTRKENRVYESHWNAIITFRYTQKPMKMLERFDNPLGFQVISYRKSQEILEK
ncbi:MAG: virB8 family protein [Alphaproteobacteria bacterium]